MTTLVIFAGLVMFMLGCLNIGLFLVALAVGFGFDVMTSYW